MILPTRIFLANSRPRLQSATRFATFRLRQTKVAPYSMTSQKIEASFETTLWEEKDITSLAGTTTRITRTRTDRTFTGGMNGPAINEYVFVYHPPNEAVTAGGAEDKASDAPRVVIFNGYMNFKGTIEGVDGEGEIVFDVNGTFGKDGVKKVVADWKTLPETGTGSFKGLKAHGGYEGAAKNMTCWLQLEQ